MQSILSSKFFKKLNRAPLIVASIGSEKSLLNSVRKAKREGADWLELRLDSFPLANKEAAVALIEKVRKVSTLPLIATIRSAREQGKKSPKFKLDDSKRKEIFEKIIPFVELIDIEISSHSINQSVIALAHKQKKKVILSYHDFSSVPSKKKINKLAAEFHALKGDIFKIAVTPRNYKEMGEFLIHCSRLPLPYKIFIAMAEIGKISRMASFSLGSCMTYGFATKETAPGQLSVKELSNFRKTFYPKL